MQPARPDSEPTQMDTTTVAPTTAQTLVDVLDWHVAQHPDRPHIQLYADQSE